MTDPQALVLAIATIVSIFATSSVLAGWVNRVWPIPALVSLIVGLGLIAFVHVSKDGGLHVLDIPNAFIQVAAMVLN